MNTCELCDRTLFYCEPCDQLSCNVCDETWCSTCRDRGEGWSGCMNCYSFCANCNGDICSKCVSHCEICSDTMCATCVCKIRTCVLCNHDLSSPIHACADCLPHVHRDDADMCEDCYTFDLAVMLTNKSGYEDVCLEDAANVVTLKACMHVWKCVADAASYAPGGRGYKRSKDEFERLQVKKKNECEAAALMHHVADV